MRGRSDRFGNSRPSASHSYRSGKNSYGGPSVSPTRSLVNRTWAGTCRILACTRTAFTGDFVSRSGRSAFPRLRFRPGLGFLRSVTHAVCPALWARARRHTVGRPCRPAPPVPSCTSGVLPPPYLLHEEGEGGTPAACLMIEDGRKPQSRPSPRPAGKNPYCYSNLPSLLAFLQIIRSAFLPPAGVLAPASPRIPSHSLAFPDLGPGSIDTAFPV